MPRPLRRVHTVKAGNVSVAFPSSIPNLDARYRGDLGVTLATGVSSWADQSGNGLTLSQATGAAQPTNSATINGHKVLTFSGSQFLTLAAVRALHDTTTLVVMRTTMTASSPQYTGDAAGSLVGDGTGGITAGFGVQSGNIMLTSINGSFVWQHVQGTKTVNDNNPHLLVGTWSRTVPGALAVYVDNVADGTGTGSTNGLGEWNSVGSGYGNGFNNGDKFTGDIAEVVIYARVLTTTELNSLHSYFKSFWGTP